MLLIFITHLYIAYKIIERMFQHVFCKKDYDIDIHIDNAFGFGRSLPGS